MTTVEAVQNARNPQEALLAIAVTLDQIMTLLPTTQSSEWGTWETPDRTTPSDSPTSPETSGQLRPSALEDGLFEGEIETPEDPITSALQQIHGDLFSLNLPAPTPETAEQRRHFATSGLRLPELYGGPIGEPPMDPVEAYVKGGPIWLYNYDREYVMTLPPEMKREMVEDVAVLSQQHAHEMARDILKDQTPDGNREAVEAVFDE